LLHLRGGMVIHSLKDLKSDDNPKGGKMPGEPIDGEKLSKKFMGMYHEKQIGGLCAVHCINNLLQGSEFDEIELADIAADMDRRERATLAGSGLEGESGNVRADGFFSVQVIQQALQLRGFSCIPVGSSEAAGVLQNPQRETGYILNRSEHWFSLRRLGQHWFDVNSTQEKPKHVTDSYLGMLLQQMKSDGYSVSCCLFLPI
jgi:ataxin-3